MFPYAINCIESLQPKAFIFENVKGLLRSTFSRYFDYILKRLSLPGSKIKSNESWEEHLCRLLKISKDSNYSGVKYDVQFKLLNAADYGVPQKRERVVIVGIRSDLKRSWTFPRPTHSEDRLIWEKYVTGDYWRSHNLPHQENEALAAAILKKYGVFPPEGQPWQTIRDALKKVPSPTDVHGIPDHIYKPGAKTYPGHTGSEIDLPSKTIKAGGHGVPGGENMIRYQDGSVRYLTTFEAKLIQTFPENFVINGAWGEAMRQIGNAVPVKLAEVIGKQMMATLEK